MLLSPVPPHCVEKKDNWICFVTYCFEYHNPTFYQYRATQLVSTHFKYRIKISHSQMSQARALVLSRQINRQVGLPNRHSTCQTIFSLSGHTISIVFILLSSTFLPFGQKVSLTQRARSIPIEISPILRNLITFIFCYQISHKPLKILSL